VSKPKLTKSREEVLVALGCRRGSIYSMGYAWTDSSGANAVDVDALPLNAVLQRVFDVGRLVGRGEMRQDIRALLDLPV
jgi:hypothetical protein